MVNLERLLTEAAKKQVEVILEQESKRACEALKERIRQLADSIALEVLQFYSVERMGQDIVIRVRKEI